MLTSKSQWSHKLAFLGWHCFKYGLIKLLFLSRWALLLCWPKHLVNLRAHVPTALRVTVGQAETSEEVESGDRHKEQKSRHCHSRGSFDWKEWKLVMRLCLRNLVLTQKTIFLHRSIFFILLNTWFGGGAQNKSRKFASKVTALPFAQLRQTWGITLLSNYNSNIVEFINYQLFY